MRPLKRLLARLAASITRRRDESRLREEIEEHLALQTAENIRAGLSPEEARRRAVLKFGAVEAVREHYREQQRFAFLELFLRDLRFAMRSLYRSPGFTFVCVVTLGLAIGACTAIYSVVYGVAIRPLPYPEPEQLVQVWQLGTRSEREQFSDPNFADVRSRVNHFAALAQYNSGTSSVIAGQSPVRVAAATVSHDFFDVFQIEPARGRRFIAEELREGARPVVVVSDRFWRQHFAHHSSLSLARLVIRDAPHTVVGVMPPGFAFPADVDLWVAKEATGQSPYRTGHNWQVVGRVKPGTTLDEARVELSTLARQIRRQYGETTWMVDATLVPLREQLVGSVLPTLRLLLASVALLLAVACANLANLLLVRISTRRRELALRSALGAGRTALARPVVAEVIWIVALGGLLGLAVARMGVLAFITIQPGLPRQAEVGLDRPVLAFTFGVAALVVLMFAGLAAWRTRQHDALKERFSEYGRNTAAGRFRDMMVVAQLTVAVVLLVGAGLFARSLSNVLNQDAGFRTRGVLTADMSVPGPEIRPTLKGLEISDPTAVPRQAQLNERLMAGLRAMPGVIEVGGTSRLPLTGVGSNGTFLIVRGDEGNTLGELTALVRDSTRTGTAEWRVVSASYFRAMGIPLIRGRLFQESDGPDAPHVAVISESLAKTRWPHQDPIGLRIQNGGMDGDLRVFTIVGIVGDVRARGLDAAAPSIFYAEYRQRPLSTFGFAFVMQSAVPPETLIPQARRVIASIAPDVPPRFRAIEEVVETTVSRRRVTFVVTAFFAGAALLLALLGVYGVLSYLVAQRQHEFGVRLALGAASRDLIGLVLRQAMNLTIWGLLLGLGAALGLSRLVAGMLFGVTPADPLIYVGVAAAIGAAAVFACQVPVIRAARVDPLVALRYE